LLINFKKIKEKEETKKVMVGTIVESVRFEKKNWGHNNDFGKNNH